MTREEALKKVRQMSLPKETMEILEALAPELTESEDERIRKEIIDFIRSKIDRGSVTKEQREKSNSWITYLEKQKINTEGDFARGYDCGYECCLHSHGAEWLEKQKEIVQWPNLSNCKHDCKTCFMKCIYRKEQNEEQKPITNEFGFKVGDKVRLKDGDGRTHIIKSFEEVEGLHGPNFYHVEFEDNSARSGIYPGKEYSNGYDTQMEKIEEEQKPAEWSEEDEYVIDKVIEWAKIVNPTSSIFEKIPKEQFIKRLKFLRLKKRLDDVDKLCSNEWSEEDRKILNTIISDGSRGVVFDAKQVNFLKSLCPQYRWKPSEQEKSALRTAIHILTGKRSVPKAAAHLQNILDAFEDEEPRKERINYDGTLPNTIRRD